MAPKVIVGLSGGVDSAVSALLLQRQGCDVAGLFMKNWEEDDTDGCTAVEDLRHARQVAGVLGIPLHTANFSDRYWEAVFENFLDEYRRGRTPNPDVLCNREIKFKAFLEHAQALGADKIATGHYAGRREDNGRCHLVKALDADKDQSYFLHLISRQSLACSLFPLAQMRKPDVRALARRHGFTCHQRKDSTGICFIGSYRFRDFLARYLPQKQGDILDEHGRVVGRHDGCWYYTIGQRQGIGIGGVSDKRELPWYVARKDATGNTITVVQGGDHPLLFSRRLTADTPHWIDRPPDNNERLHCKIRHRQEDQGCTIKFRDDGRVDVHFDRAQRSVAPGQSVVFYRGRECLGGGVIADAGNNL